jgi:hypothetical protein
VEIVTRGERRRRFRAEEKVRLVAETWTPPETPGVAAVMMIRFLPVGAQGAADVIGPRRVLGRAGSPA